MNIQTVTIIGANGIMGAQSAGIIAGFGKAKIFMVARTIEKAKKGIEIAVQSIKSNTIRDQLIPSTYRNLKRVLSESDWVIEAVTETLEAKKEINSMIAQYGKKNRIVSTLTSGFSINDLSQSFQQNDRKNYLGIHFFNPPYKIPLCEIVPSQYSDKKMVILLKEYLEKTLLRVVILTKDTPGFVANRIGFYVLNEAAQLAETYKTRGGIALVDELLGTYIGRSSAPLATIDFVGLDTHAAIVNNIYNKTNDYARKTFTLPTYIQELIHARKLGRKTNGGLYSYSVDKTGLKETYMYDISSKKYILCPMFQFPFIKHMKEKIHDGDYINAMEILKKSKESEADIVRYCIASYINYSIFLVGKIVDSIDIIDTAMSSGYHWLPPSSYIQFLGGTNKAFTFIHRYFPISKSDFIKKVKRANTMSTQSIDVRSFIKI